MNRISFFISLFGLILLPQFSAAQVRPVKTPGAMVIADQYFREGAFDKALIEYQKAFEVDYNPAIYYNIAQCLHRMEHYQKAILFYELYISKNLSSSMITHVQNHITECEKKMQEAQKLQEAHTKTVPGKRKVAVVSDPVGAEVYVDSFTGSPVGLAPLMLEFDTTPHLIVLKKSGYKDHSQLVDVGVPGMTLLRFVLEDLSGRPATVRQMITAPGTPAGVIPEENRPLRAGGVPDVTRNWWFWTGIASTTVFTISGIITGLTTLDLKAQFEDTGDESIKDRGEKYRTWTDILIGGALVSALATGVGLVLFYRDADAKKQKISLLPSCGIDGCGLALSFSF